MIFLGTLATTIKKVVNPTFDNACANITFGYFLILVGAGCTILVQSSSIFTSTLTPMVGMDLVKVETVYPLFLGSNIGTTFTAILGMKNLISAQTQNLHISAPFQKI